MEFREASEAEIGAVVCGHEPSLAVYLSAQDTVLFCPACHVVLIQPAFRRGDRFFVREVGNALVPFLVRGRS